MNLNTETLFNVNKWLFLDVKYAARQYCESMKDGGGKREVEGTIKSFIEGHDCNSFKRNILPQSKRLERVTSQR